MRSRFRIPLLLLLSLALVACAALNSPAKQQKEALDKFMYALRWRLHPEAAAYFTDEYGEAFLAQMEALVGLNVTEVRLNKVEIKEEGQRADTVMEMDYFILPSTTLKTLKIKQTWRYLGPAGADGRYLITTPFPQLP